MKTTAGSVREQVNSGEKKTLLTFDKEEMLCKLPAVVLVMKLPAITGEPVQLVFASPGLKHYTGFDPEELKTEEGDFYARLLPPEEVCKTTNLLEIMMSNPLHEVNGMVFKINAVWNECLWVICNCRLLPAYCGNPVYVISNCLVYDAKTFPKDALRNCLKELDRIAHQKSLSELSKREIEVLTCIGKGLSLKEISNKFFISYRTVETHLANIKEKLDLHTINALAAFAISAGLY
jgi:DNA-binding CsgD family transcriptional regulator